MKDRFTNLQIFPDQKTLFREEIDTVMLLMYEILDLFDERPTRGSIALYGQKRNEESQKILQVDLEDGDDKVLNNGKIFGEAMFVSTAKMVENSAIVYSPREPERGFDSKYSGVREGGGRCCANRLALVANTTEGRFTISAYVGNHDMNIAVMKGIAVALSKMGKEDLVLQQSVKELMKNMTAMERKIKDEVENLLYFCSLPELQAWKEWHEAAMAKGNGLALYFG